MSLARVLIGATLLAAIVAGTIAEVPRPAATTRMLGGYHVLAADFHVHTFPQTWSTLPPCETLREARRQALDVIAMTPHNQISWAKVGRWCSQTFGGPIVIVGEEIAARGYHLLGIGLTRAVSPDQPLSSAIDEVHAQGGFTIAAHPYKGYWPAYDADVMGKLDAAEVIRPESRHDEGAAKELREFFARAPLTAIGDSDYHGLGPIGYVRTYVFARTRDEAGVLDALRARRTVVYGRDRAFGDPALIELAAADAGLPKDVPDLPVPGVLSAFSRIAGALGLLAALLLRPQESSCRIL
jgi:predicted metal-dependent phosphoesterase TrpH